jgi:hypothetical protein
MQKLGNFSPFNIASERCREAFMSELNGATSSSTPKPSGGFVRQVLFTGKLLVIASGVVGLLWAIDSLVTG